MCAYVVSKLLCLQIMIHSMDCQFFDEVPNINATYIDSIVTSNVLECLLPCQNNKECKYVIMDVETGADMRLNCSSYLDGGSIHIGIRNYVKCQYNCSQNRTDTGEVHLSPMTPYTTPMVTTKNTSLANVSSPSTTTISASDTTPVGSWPNCSGMLALLCLLFDGDNNNQILPTHKTTRPSVITKHTSIEENLTDVTNVSSTASGFSLECLIPIYVFTRYADSGRNAHLYSFAPTAQGNKSNITATMGFINSSCLSQIPAYCEPQPIKLLEGVRLIYDNDTEMDSEAEMYCTFKMCELHGVTLVPYYEFQSYDNYTARSSMNYTYTNDFLYSPVNLNPNSSIYNASGYYAYGYSTRFVPIPKKTE